MVKENTARKFALSAVIAGIAGYLVGILTAPKSGKETRKDIKDTADKTVLEAERELKQLHTQLTHTIDEAKNNLTKLTGKAKEDLNKAIEQTKAVKEKARDILSAFHEGDAGDQDLEKAIKQAQKALDALKSKTGKSKKK